MSVIGFSGTRRGLTGPQSDTLRSVLKQQGEAVSYSHGQAIGADAEFARTVRGLYPFAFIVAHPCTLASQRDRTAPADTVLTAKPPLLRNKDIVAACDLLIACPAGMEETLRSGTWSTIRWARKAGKRVIIVWPDGTQSEEAGAKPRTVTGDLPT